MKTFKILFFILLYLSQTSFAEDIKNITSIEWGSLPDETKTRYGIFKLQDSTTLSLSLTPLDGDINPESIRIYKFNNNSLINQKLTVSNNLIKAKLEKGQWYLITKYFQENKICVNPVRNKLPEICRTINNNALCSFEALVSSPIKNIPGIPSIPPINICIICSQIRVDGFNPGNCPDTKTNYFQCNLKPVAPDPFCNGTYNKGSLVLNVRDIGAIPDDSLDDYVALKEAANLASNRTIDNDERYKNINQKLHIIFPKGTYNINRYINEIPKPYNSEYDIRFGFAPIQYECNKNKDRVCTRYDLDIVYQKANNVEIHGCGSVIDVLQTPYRDTIINVTYEAKNELFRFYTNKSTIAPFILAESNNISIHDIELNGNVDKSGRISTGCENGQPIPKYKTACTTFLKKNKHDPKKCDLMCKKPDSARFPASLSTGLIVTGSEHYSLQNIYSHHFAGDGIYLGHRTTLNEERIPWQCTSNQQQLSIGQTRYKSDYDGKLSKVASCNNARGALSIAQANKLHINHSFFAFSGKTGTQDFPGHAPQHGLDIEGSLPKEIEINNGRIINSNRKTGNILIENTTFEGNIGSQVVSFGRNDVDGLTLKNVQIIPYKDAFSCNAMNLDIKNLCTTNTTFKLNDTIQTTQPHCLTRPSSEQKFNIRYCTASRRECSSTPGVSIINDHYPDSELFSYQLDKTTQCRNNICSNGVACSSN